MSHCSRGVFASFCAALIAALVQSSAVLADVPQPAAAASVTSLPAQPPIDPTQADALELAQAMTTSFPDVPANHWAYDAVSQLAASGYIKGYPDQTFKGNRPMTRYEVAYLVAQVVQGMADKSALGQKASQADLDALKKLMAGFGTEVKDLQGRVTRLEAQTATLQQQTNAVKSEADATKAQSQATTDRLAAGKLGFRYFDRPGTIYSNVQIAAPAGVLTAAGAVTPGTVGQIPNNFGAVPGTSYGTAFPWGVGTNNRTPVGPQSHGTNILYGAVYYSGNFGQGFNYGARISTRLATENGSGLTTASPAFCTSTATINGSPSTCSYGDLANTSGNIPTALDYAYVGYTSPGGFFANLGRFSLSEYLYNVDPARWAGSNVTGVQIGITDPKKNYQIWAAYLPATISNYSLSTAQSTGANAICSTNVVGLNLGGAVPTGLNASCNAGQQEFASSGQYLFRKSRTSFGYEFDGDWNLAQTYWVPSAVACSGGVNAAGATNIALSGAVCAANGGHIPAGPALGNAFSGAFVTATGPNAAGWVDISQYWGCCHDLGQFNASLEYGSRFGNDPFTGSHWAGSNMVQAILTYASKGNLYGSTPNALIPGAGIANSNVVQLYWEYAGLGAGTNGYTFNGSVIPENNTAWSNAAGTQHWTLQLDHWFNANFRAGITFMHFNNNSNVAIPAGGLTCPGCFVNNAQMNQVYLDTWLYVN
jgi:hypothetical protein